MPSDRRDPENGVESILPAEGIFRAIYHSVNDAIFVQDAETAEILDVNEAAVEMYGYSRPEFRDLTIEDLSSGTPPYTQETAVEYLEQALEGDPQVFEWRARDCNDDLFWVEVSMRRAVVDDHDFVFVIVRDVSERKARQEELRQLSEEYEAIFENAADAIFLIDVEHVDAGPTFRFERLNPAHEATSGLTTEEVRGKTPREALGEDLGAEVEANYRRCVEGREPITYQEELPMPDGTVVWQTNLSPVIVDGEVTRIVGSARDVTERVARERQLQQQNERLDEFASVISHDLRNPLNVAKGRAALLETDCVSEHLPPIVTALDRMESIIEDTLTLAREGETVGETEPVDVDSVVEQCWEMIDPADGTVELVDSFTIRGDRDRICHVFENLFRNAVDHAGPGVRVCVGRLDADGFYVEDDGPGIPESSRKTVFDPGYTSEREGTGFGLTIVKRIAEAHGWAVEITDGTDGGARFEFTGVELVSS